MINKFCKKPLWECSTTLSAVAQGLAPAETVIKGAKLVNVCTAEIQENVDVAIAEGRITAPVVLGRDHHDVSGTDSPYRETSNIYDGSNLTADMAVQNVIGDAFRGATWVSIHNGGGVGWGEVVNGGFGMVIDGSEESGRRIREMLFWDVNNGIARRSWARNDGAVEAIRREMARTPGLQVTLPNSADDNVIRNALNETES